MQADHDLGGQPDDDANVSNPHIKLPPPVLSSSVYRCDDNSVIYVDFLGDGKSANLRTTESGPVIRLAAADAGKPFQGEDYVLDGNGPSVKFAAPHKKSQACKS